MLRKVELLTLWECLDCDENFAVVTEDKPPDTCPNRCCRSGSLRAFGSVYLYEEVRYIVTKRSLAIDLCVAAAGFAVLTYFVLRVILDR